MASAKPGIPYSMDMDSEKARQLVENGGTLLLLQVPQGTAIGIDHQVFLSGPKFCGVKMLPPGPHLLTYYAIGSSGTLAAPTSRWVVLHAKQVVVLRWQPEAELLEELPDEDERERYALGARRFDFDSGLAPYNLSAFPVWKLLAADVSQRTLDRLLPPCLNTSVTAEARPPAASSAAEARLDEQLRSGAGPMDVEQAPGTSGPDGEGSRRQSSSVGSCSFTALPLRVSGEGLTPEQLTAANMDKSAALDSLIRDQYDGDERELLAEFQTAFLNFVLGHSLQAYAQWKDFLVLVCSCAQAISPRHGRSGLICSFAKTLRVQLQVTLEAEASTPSGMMGDATPFGVPMVEELLAASFLRPLLGGWLEDIQDPAAEVEPDLRQEGRRIRDLLAKRLGMDLAADELSAGDQGDEYAPVIVET
uniref:A1 cistron-splicing factor AAR2 n=1 Tax=Tetraselmis sp. GSL018 TaxID=582737 RepID=A0A061R3I3_9CHLO